VLAAGSHHRPGGVRTARWQRRHRLLAAGMARGPGRPGHHVV